MLTAPAQGRTVGVRLPATLALLFNVLQLFQAVGERLVMPPLGVAPVLISGMQRMHLKLGRYVYSRHVNAFIHSTPVAIRGIDDLLEERLWVGRRISRRWLQLRQ